MGMDGAGFSEPFIRRPVGTTLLAIGLFLTGAVAYRFLPVASMPTVDFPTINVTATRPGADPETMAATVAAPLERKLGHPARSLGLALAGEPRLRAPGYRAISAVLRAGLAGNWKAFWGAFRRGRERANQEPLA